MNIVNVIINLLKILFKTIKKYTEIFYILKG